MPWILASASPRRRDILSHLGLRFEIRVADTDEHSEQRDPARLVEELAARKAAAVARAQPMSPDTVIIAADTVVLSPDGEILGKPRDRADAARMMRTLSGRSHRVISGLAVWRNGRLETAHEMTEVRFSLLSEELIEQYVATAEPYDKAGGYGIQDTAALWIEGIRGDYFNVVGLPVRRLEDVLQAKFGLSLWNR